VREFDVPEPELMMYGSKILGTFVNKNLQHHIPTSKFQRQFPILQLLIITF